MNQDEIKELKRLIVLNASYYNAKLTEDILIMHAEDLSDLPLEMVRRGFEIYRRSPKSHHAPLPAQIRDLILPAEDRERDDLDVARETAARILTALSKFGNTNLEQAKAFVGEVGWQVISLQGGWQTLCECVMEQDRTTHQAQWRDLALSVIRRTRSGQNHEPPKLPNKIGSISLRNLIPEMPR